MPGFAKVVDQGGEGAADQAVGDVGNARGDEIVAAADGEGHADAGVGWRRGMDVAVGGGIVASSVHGIGAGFV